MNELAIATLIFLTLAFLLTSTIFYWIGIWEQHRQRSKATTGEEVKSG